MVQSKVKDSIKAYLVLKNTTPTRFAPSLRVSCNLDIISILQPYAVIYQAI